MKYLELGINTILNQVVRMLDKNIDKYNHGKVYMDMKKNGFKFEIRALLEGRYDPNKRDFLVENETHIFDFNYECDIRENGFLILSYLKEDYTVSGKYIEAKMINSLYRKIMKIKDKKGYLISTSNKDYFLVIKE